MLQVNVCHLLIGRKHLELNTIVWFLDTKSHLKKWKRLAEKKLINMAYTLNFIAHRLTQFDNVAEMCYGEKSHHNNLSKLIPL